jgi:hypothetical protein
LDCVPGPGVPVCVPRGEYRDSVPQRFRVEFILILTVSAYLLHTAVAPNQNIPFPWMEEY